MAERVCECGGPVPSGRRSPWCSSWCVARSAQGLPPQAPPPSRPPSVLVPVGGGEVRLPVTAPGRSGMQARVRAAFEAAGTLDGWEAGAALDLARSIDEDGGAGSARAALHRELRALMADAMRGVDEPGSRVGSMRDELAARRAGRAGRAGGA